jgi:hypothetical protein
LIGEPRFGGVRVKASFPSGKHRVDLLDDLLLSAVKCGRIKWRTAMNNKDRRKWTASQKLKIVLQTFYSDSKLAEITAENLDLKKTL